MSNGQEIWDEEIAISSRFYLLEEIKRLKTDIRSIGKGCGDCSKWMCRECPREINVNGRSRGPSMNAPICCLYVEKGSSSLRREELQKELETLLLDLRLDSNAGIGKVLY